MAFSPSTLTILEDALTDCFFYHNELENFLIRLGIDQAIIEKSKEDADRKSDKFNRAPKRFIVQALINNLSMRIGCEDIFSGIIEEILKGSFQNANENGLNALERLRNDLAVNRDLEKSEKIRKQREILEAESESQKRRQEEIENVSAKRLKLTEILQNLFDEKNKQERGYDLEKILNELFYIENLNPRKSFKNTGEQIDGSFEWRGQTHFLEAKWTKEKSSGKDFSSLMYKIE